MLLGLLGLVSLAISLQYALLMPPVGRDESTRERYELLSAIFGCGGVMLVVISATLIVIAIRRMNAETRN